MKKIVRKKKAKRKQRKTNSVTSRTRFRTLKTVALWLAVGMCAGLVASPHLPPEAMQWALWLLKALAAGVVKQFATKSVA